MGVRVVITKHEEYRRRRGYSVTALASAVGVSHTYVSLVEGRKTKPSPRYRKAVSRVLGVAEELIFGDEGTQ